MRKRSDPGVKDVLEQFSRHSTIHGCSEIFSFRSAWRALWVLVMLVVMCFCGSQLFYFIREFVNDPKTTSITYDYSLPVPMALTKYMSLHWLNRTVLKRMNADPRVTETLLRKYLFDSYFWPTRCSRDLLEKDVIEQLNDLHRRKEIPRPINLHDIMRSKRALRRLLASHKMNITNLYESMVRDDVDLHNSTAWYDAVEFYMKIHPVRRLGLYGIASEYHFVNLNFTRNTAIRLVTESCASPDQTIRFGMNSRMLLKDENPSQNFQCLHKYKVTVRFSTETQHPKYCDPKATAIPLTCENQCMIREARRQGNSCLPYFGHPIVRLDIPYCGFSLMSCSSSIQDDCVRYCEECKSCRSCSEVTSEMTITKFPMKGANATLITVALDGRQRFQHFHTEPKYSAATLVSGIGGILGIGFGMSVMSLLQAFLYCARILRSLMRSSKEVNCAKEGRDNPATTSMLVQRRFAVEENGGGPPKWPVTSFVRASVPDVLCAETGFASGNGSFDDQPLPKKFTWS